MTETHIIVLIKLSNKAAWPPATSKAGLFVTANSQKLLTNVAKSFIVDFIGVLDGIYPNQDLSARYSIKSYKKGPNSSC